MGLVCVWFICVCVCVCASVCVCVSVCSMFSGPNAHALSKFLNISAGRRYACSAGWGCGFGARSTRKGCAPVHSTTAMGRGLLSRVPGGVAAPCAVH